MPVLSLRIRRKKALALLLSCAFLSLTWSQSCSGPKRAGDAGQAEAKENDVSTAAAAQRTDQKKEAVEPCDCPPGAGEGASEVTANPFAQDDWDQGMERLKQVFDACQAAAEDIPRDTFEPQAILDEVGDDPEVLFRWVRDNTRLAAYEGVLRGPIGVLMDRTGNSLDRALLLHELFRKAGYEARLAHAGLSKARARELADEPTLARAAMSSSGGGTRPAIDDFLSAHEGGLGMTPDEFKAYVRRTEEESRKSSAEVAERVARQAAQIQEAIKGIPLKPAGDDLAARAERLRDHWWVQLENEETWTDYDPGPTGLEPGQTIVRAEKTCQPDDLEPEMRHSVTVRVLAESWRDGVLASKPVLVHALDAPGTLGQRIVLRYIPMNWPQDFSFAGAEDPSAELRSKVIAETEWQPLLVVGSEKIAQSSFTDTGEINKNPGKKSGGGDPGAIAGGLFGALGGGGEEKEEKAATGSILTAVWVEFTSHRPGRADVTERRTVFDLLGPAPREASPLPKPEIADSDRLERALALLGEADLVVQCCRLSPEYEGYLVAESLLANRTALEDLLQPIDAPDDLAARIDKFSDLTPLPSPAFHVAGARLGWSDARDGLYLDQSNVIRYVRAPASDRQGKITIRSGFDIVFNDLAPLSATDRDAFRSRLYQGVLDTNVEAVIMRSTGRSIDNVAELVALSDTAGADWIALNGPTDPALRELKTSKDRIARLRQDLKEGYIVVAPLQEINTERGPSYGWWRLSPHSGSIIGVGDEGGQALAEYGLKVAHFVEGVVCLVEFTHVKSAVAFFCRVFACTIALYQVEALHWAWKTASWSLFRLAGVTSILNGGLSHLCSLVDKNKH